MHRIPRYHREVLVSSVVESSGTHTLDCRSGRKKHHTNASQDIPESPKISRAGGQHPEVVRMSVLLMSKSIDAFPIAVVVDLSSTISSIPRIL